MKRVDWGLVAVLLLLAAGLRGYQLGAAPLIGDEAYYWLWSEHLAWSYVDNPAGMGVMVRLSTALAGSSEWGVRWLNAALGVASVLFCYLIGRQLFDRPAAAVSALVLAVGAPYVVISRFVYTDQLQLSLLLFNLYLVLPIVLARDTHRVSTWRFWAVGLSMAALLNTKYSAYLYAAVLLGWLIWHRSAVLSDQRAWWAIGMGAIGLVPVLAWNAAHDWISFRWQWQHFGTGRLDLLGNVRHALVYVTLPVALIAAGGATRWRGRMRQVLLIPGLALTLPVMLSPANSPRNLSSGLIMFVLLAGDAVGGWAKRWRASVVWTAVGLVLLLCVLYGVGTVIGTLQPTVVPHSSVVPALRAQGAGWRQASELPLRPDAAIFCVDYDAAGQLWYYAGRPVHTAWKQYQLWMMNEACRPGGSKAPVQMLALEYVEPDLISTRLHAVFDRVAGPETWRLDGAQGRTVLHAWTAEGCRVDGETFVQRFDLIELIQDRGLD